jgi:hypothetical protein
MVTVRMTEAALPSRSVEARLDELESRAAIQRLLADYCHGIDKRDLDRFVAVWHPDASLTMGEPIGDFHGIDEICRFVTELVWETLLPESHHWTTNTSLSFSDADHGEALSDVLAAAVDADGNRLTIAATYRDVFERRAGEWRFLRRAAEVHYQLPVAVPGEAEGVS